jgi:hypothetical protein
MSRTVETRRVGPWQLTAPFLWILAAGPLPVIVGMVRLVRRRATGRWLVVSVPAVAGTIAILFYPDGWFSPRYMLATVPLAFFLPAAAWLAERPRYLAIGLMAPLVAMPLILMPVRAITSRGEAVMDRVAQLPRNAFVVPGHYCSNAQLAATIHARRDLSMMCPGWGWPADPVRVLDEALASGRPSPRFAGRRGGRRTNPNRVVRAMGRPARARNRRDFVVERQRQPPDSR